MRKSNSPSAPNCDGGLAPTVAVTCGRGGRLPRQALGTRTIDAGGFEPRHVGQQLQRLGGGPSQRIVDLVGVEQAPQPRRLLRGAIHRQEQRQELRFVQRTGVLASAWPSGRCLGRAVDDRCVVYVAMNANGASSSLRCSARLK